VLGNLRAGLTYQRGWIQHRKPKRGQSFCARHAFQNLVCISTWICLSFSPLFQHRFNEKHFWQTERERKKLFFTTKCQYYAKKFGKDCLNKMAQILQDGVWANIESTIDLPRILNYCTTTSTSRACTISDCSTLLWILTGQYKKNKSSYLQSIGQLM